MNTKLHAVTDTSSRPIRFFITAGQVSDYTGAAALLSGLPDAEWLLADRGYDADWFREALTDRGTRPCIPGRKSRNKTVRYDKRRYKRRNRIERMFGRLNDWRRGATRYDRCPKVFLSAIALAATVIFWLRVLNLASTEYQIVFHENGHGYSQRRTQYFESVMFQFARFLLDRSLEAY
jgi:transposase